MSLTIHEKGKPVALTINGLAVNASTDMTLVEAAWHGGVPRITNIGCMEGVCGSCRVMLRRGKEVSVGLACQTFVEDGIEVVFMPPASAPQHHYDINDLKDGWDIHARFHKIFPEASRCRHCHGCNTACPKGIAVEDGVGLAAAGRYREAGETFFECIMCELCDAACPELIAPAHVGLFSRRVTAHFHLRPPNLIHRLEELRQGKSKTAPDGRSKDATSGNETRARLPLSNFPPEKAPHLNPPPQAGEEANVKGTFQFSGERANASLRDFQVNEKDE